MEYKTCAKCKVSLSLSCFYSRSAECKSCCAAGQAVYRIKNKNEISVQRASYRAANKEKLIASRASFYAANRERISQRNAAWVASNKEAVVAYRSAYRTANKEKHKIWSANHYAKNKKESLKNPKQDDITGQMFGRLTVLSYSEKKGHSRYWKCQCDCGSAPVSIRGSRMLAGITQSCGCLAVELTKKRMTKHKLGVDKKVCSRCNVSLELHHFGPGERMTLGLSSSCRKCDAENSLRAWHEMTPQQALRRSYVRKAWLKENEEYLKNWQTLKNRKNVDTITDSYVASVLGMRRSDVPQELIEAKRAHLKTHRLIKEKMK